MKTLGEQVKAFMRAHDFRSADIAEMVRRAGATTVQRQHIEGLLGGISRPRYLPELAAAMGTTVEALTAGVFDPASADPGPVEPQPIDLDAHANLVSIRRVQLRLQAGVDGFSIEADESNGSPLFFRADWLQLRGYKPYNLIAIKVRGQSMEPTLFPDDMVVINTADTEPKDGKVYAVNYEGEAVIKRMVRDNGSWWLSSDNPDQRRFPRKECAEEACIVVGRVVHRQSEEI